MILVETSVWVDHLRGGNRTLGDLLDAGLVLSHPFVLGELALGDIRQRALVLTAFSNLPQAAVATYPEVLSFIDRHRLFGSGIGYVDAHLLASARLTAGTTLWSKDRRLAIVAERLGLSMATTRG